MDFAEPRYSAYFTFVTYLCEIDTPFDVNILGNDIL